MPRLKIRMHRLESAAPHRISPAIKRWLGVPLTQQEAVDLERQPRAPFNPNEVESSDLPRDMKKWLLEA